MADATIPEGRTAEYRHCARCGSKFHRNKKYSDRQWESARWCSRRCGAWNVGLTKHDDPRIMALAEQVAVSAKGRPAWNKGLTKETHPSLALISRKISESQKGRKINAAQRAGLAHGWNWAKGRTKENTPSIARSAAYRSGVLKGRRNPEHGAWLKDFYEKNPHKHPNAILAKKTKGKGKTHIEVLLGQYLEELGLRFKYHAKVGRRWPDYSSAGLQLAIEADGERWHQDKKRERQRDSEFHALGWSILHLTGALLVTDPSECKRRILEAVADAKQRQGFRDTA